MPAMDGMQRGTSGLGSQVLGYGVLNTNYMSVTGMTLLYGSHVTLGGPCRLDAVGST